MEWEFKNTGPYARWSAKSVLPSALVTDLFTSWIISMHPSGEFTLAGTNWILTGLHESETFASFLLAKTFCELKQKMFLSLLENDPQYISRRAAYTMQEVREEDNTILRILQGAIADRKLQITNQGLEIGINVVAEKIPEGEQGGVFLGVSNAQSAAEAFEEVDKVCDEFGLDKDKIRDRCVNKILNRMADTGVLLGEFDFGVFCVIAMNTETGDVKYVSNLDSVPKVSKLLGAVTQTISSMASEMN